jgi:hypothetical protein
MFALTLVPVAGLIGAGVDFTLSAKRKALLDAVAYSASLAAVTPAMLAQNDQASVTAATALFNSQTATMTGIGAVSLSVNVTDSGLTRTVAVSYQTTSTTMFGNLIGKSSVPHTMVAHTTDQCAFACHEADKSPNDYYGLARSLGLTLRMDLLRQATQNFMTTAQTAETNNNASYRAAIYTFNIGFNTIASLTSSLSTAKSQAGNIDIYEVPQQNWSTTRSPPIPTR